MKYPIDKSLVGIDETRNGLVPQTTDAAHFLRRVHEMLDHQLPPGTTIDNDGAMIIPAPYVAMDIFASLTDLDLISQI